METKDFLQILKRDIHTTVMATVDAMGHPVTRVIDVMLVDDHTLYFLTAKGKIFYEQLMNQQYVALSGVYGGEKLDKKEASLHMKSISIRGKVQNIGTSKLNEIFEENSYMADIYPSQTSRKALEVFCISEGEGEFFDLSTKPITRSSFTVGLCKTSKNAKIEKNSGGYFISKVCTGCGSCLSVCPQSCIISYEVPFKILSEHCLHCGNCMSVCPVQAVICKKEKEVK